ncbi:MAG: hypothetical protein ACM30G_02305 [Micromonosporaceae bacterium]
MAADQPAWQDGRVRVTDQPLLRAGISRRRLLRGLVGAAGAVATGAALTGCDLVRDDGPPSLTTAALDAFLRDTLALAALYDAVLIDHPDLGTTLTPIRDAHRAHASALSAALGRSVPTPGAAAVPSAQAQAVATLVTAERTGRDAAIEACVGNAARLAPLLGSIAAARATHLEVLS